MRLRSRVNGAPTEAQEQRALFRWAAYETGKYPELALMHHIPNGGSRDPREAHNLKEQGVKAGVPDIFLPVARGSFHGLYIEMKRQQGGHVEPVQKWWQTELTKQGYRSVICKGFFEARDEILKYLGANEKEEK